MANTAVVKWAFFANGPPRVARDILISRRAGVDVYLTPARRCETVNSITITNSMWRAEPLWCAVYTANRSVPVSLPKSPQRSCSFDGICLLHTGRVTCCRSLSMLTQCTYSIVLRMITASYVLLFVRNGSIT